MRSGSRADLSAGEVAAWAGRDAEACGHQGPEQGLLDMDLEACEDQNRGSCSMVPQMTPREVEGQLTANQSPAARRRFVS